MYETNLINTGDTANYNHGMLFTDSSKLERTPEQPDCESIRVYPLFPVDCLLEHAVHDDDRMRLIAFNRVAVQLRHDPRGNSALLRKLFTRRGGLLFRNRNIVRIAGAFAPSPRSSLAERHARIRIVVRPHPSLAFARFGEVRSGDGRRKLDKRPTTALLNLG